MNPVCGLAPETRRHYLCTVQRLLFEKFADHSVVISAIKPEDLRRFIAHQSKLYKTPDSIRSLVSTLRGYFRFRATRVDLVHHLIGEVCYPANWQLASLPKILSRTEI